MDGREGSASMAKRGEHKRNIYDQRTSSVRNNPRDSTPVTTGSHK
jgi:hypothetical protein